ncbi:IclR family transcriptional regulator [Paenibacillus eucommiae]|uniref:DNA-binding IclR family transcriptional regulator n=1 Tax=Paenibacillus eucommiae TaxID=1355755 RepID=A0ABS4IZX2_9BACL|nr:IclR family transcriptional regulator [Paenibacillus eucommiae]MBP1993142.1 DNA-binding IclR family transcriptional regulator [Paenibacillus eucommiae]
MKDSKVNIDDNENIEVKETKAAKEAPYFMIQSVDRTLNILQCFIEERRPLGVSEVARKLKLHKSVVHRLMLTLQAHSYLEQVKNTDKYMVGPKAFEFGSVYTNSTNLVDEGRRTLVELVDRLGFTAHLAILEKDSVLYLLNVEPENLKYLFGAVGQRRPIYNTALGKCLTAWLPEEEVVKALENCKFEKMTDHTILSLEAFITELERVRQVGFAIDNEESSFGVRCFAAPVRNQDGEVIAAISVSGYAVAEEKINEFGITIKSMASQLSRRMGHFE